MDYISSDYHLGHANIIKYCGRPFKDLNHMNHTIIKNHVARIKSIDNFWHLGDFCFKNSSEIRGEGSRNSAEDWKALLTGNMVFIKGNHDRNNSLKTILFSCTIEFGGEQYFLVHRPQDCNPSYKINFVGHVHQRWKYRKYKETTLINVGIDVNDFMPKTIEETLKDYKKHIKNHRVEEYVLETEHNYA